MSAMKSAAVLAGALAMCSVWSVAATSAPASRPAPQSASAPASVPASKAAAAADKITPGVWLTNYDEAVRQAKALKLPILADFTGSDWCGWCIKLKGEVFDKPEFKTWAAKNVVLLELDFPRAKPQDAATKAQNRQLSDKYDIQGFPTILFLNPDGKVIGKSGYQPGGPAAWIADAENIIKPK
jgi:protein disulfide-isomerase